MAALGATMRVLRPAPGLLAFYDGRIPGVRAYSQAPNWVDDGAYELGIASYAVIAGDEALVYDTHTSPAHAQLIRSTLADAGVTRLRVVLSHWHLDHVAGNEAFADCEIIAHALTAQALRDHRSAIESGRHVGAPAIDPLVLPTATYEGMMALTVGGIAVELRHVDIHSRDGTMLVLPDADLLLAGDALEDPVTYVAEPDRLEHHLRDLARMAGWGMRRILPNHGAEATIARGGYGPGLIAATQHYVRALLRCRDEPRRGEVDLRGFVAEDLARGEIAYFAAYEAVHHRNVQAVLTSTPETLLRFDDDRS